MPKKQTLEEFIKKSNIAHNFKYNYDKSIYINKQTKVIVTCPEHGDFEVTPGAHYILKSGCPECAKISRSKTKSKGLEKFIKQANLKWNSFYNYSKVNYINNYTKVEIICPIHGSFFKDPRSHIDPQRYGGCQSCSKERLSKIISKVQQQKPKGTNREAFIDYCNGIHNNKYSYDTTLNLPNTNVSSLTTQTLISNGISTFNNEIKVSTIAPLSSSPIEVTAPVNFTSNSNTNFSGNINTPNINVTDLVTVASSKIQTNDLGEFIIGQNIQTPTTANNGAHRFTVTDINKTAIALGHKIVKNGTWATGWVIPTDRWDFTYNGEAILQVKEPKTNKEASNKLYVDTQISAISQFDPSSNQTISGTWEFTKPLKVTEAQLADEAVSKGYVDTSLSSKANSADVYTKTESDGKYATKTEVTAIKATADAAAPQSTIYTKTEVDTSLNTTVKLTGNQTVAGVKTFTDNVKIPLPQANDDAASKEYVDAVVADIPVYNPAEAQTITGAYDFQDGLTRATKSSPLATDIMNKEMSDALYIPKTGNSDIGGIKTFTDGIILADEKQLQLGAGTDALKIHGTGNGKAVIEGSNISELDIAVPVNIQENLQVENLTVDITNRGLVDFITFQNEAASLSNMQFFIDSSTNNIGIKPADSDGGFQVQNNGWLVALSTFQANGSFISQGGATFSQSITVAGTATLNNGISLKNGITFYDNTSLQEAKIIGEYGSPDESAIVFADSASINYLKFNHHSANKQVQISPQVSGDTIVFPELPESTVTPTNINQFTNKNYVDETIQQNLNTTLEGVIKFVSMTEAEYKALETKSPSTIYHLTDVSMWAIGDQEIVTSNMPA